MEVRGVEQDFIPCVGQLVPANVSFEGWIIDPDVRGLLDGPCGVGYLSTHYAEVFHADMMTHNVGMVIEGGRSSKVFP